VANNDADKLVDQFLDFLAKDMDSNPDSVRSFDHELVNRIHRLVGNSNVDLDKPLSGNASTLKAEK